MKIKLQNNSEQIALIKAMASPNRDEAIRAREAFATFIGPIIQQVLNFKSTANKVFVNWPYNEDDEPEFPLDMFYGAGVDTVQVWQQSIAGGLGSSLVTGLQTLKLSTYHLDTAWSLLEKNVKRGRLPVVALALNRAANELAVKQDRNAWLVALKALGEATTNATLHTIPSTTQNVLQLDDFNRLITLGKRLNTAFNGGTPDAMYSKGPSDLFMSPEMVEQIRGFAYQPMNTRIGAQGTAGTPVGGSTAVALPDATREAILADAGMTSIFGIAINEMLEFGITRAYNVLFGNYAQAGIANAGGNFAAATDEIVVGVDVAREAFLRPVAQNADNGAEFVAKVDDSFSARSGKIGWYGGIEEGRICTDARAVVGLVV